MSKTVVIATRVKKGFRDEIRKFVKQSGLYLNEAEFMRVAIREKLDREFQFLRNHSYPQSADEKR